MVPWLSASSRIQSQPKGPQQVIGILADLNILSILHLQFGIRNCFNTVHAVLNLLGHPHELQQPQPRGLHHVPVVLGYMNQHGTILKQFLIQNCTCKMDKKLIFVISIYYLLGSLRLGLSRFMWVS